MECKIGVSYTTFSFDDFAKCSGPALFEHENL